MVYGVAYAEYLSGLFCIWLTLISPQEVGYVSEAKFAG